MQLKLRWNFDIYNFSSRSRWNRPKWTHRAVIPFAIIKITHSPRLRAQLARIAPSKFSSIRACEFHDHEEALNPLFRPAKQHHVPRTTHKIHLYRATPCTRVYTRHTRALPVLTSSGYTHAHAHTCTRARAHSFPTRSSRSFAFRLHTLSRHILSEAR